MEVARKDVSGEKVVLITSPTVVPFVAHGVSGKSAEASSGPSKAMPTLSV